MRSFGNFNFDENPQLSLFSKFNIAATINGIDLTTMFARYVHDGKKRSLEKKKHGIFHTICEMLDDKKDGRCITLV